METSKSLVKTVLDRKAILRSFLIVFITSGIFGIISLYILASINSNTPFFSDIPGSPFLVPGTSTIWIGTILFILIFALLGALLTYSMAIEDKQKNAVIAFIFNGLYLFIFIILLFSLSPFIIIIIASAFANPNNQF